MNHKDGGGFPTLAGVTWRKQTYLKEEEINLITCKSGKGCERELGLHPYLTNKESSIPREYLTQGYTASEVWPEPRPTLTRE